MLIQPCSRSGRTTGSAGCVPQSTHKENRQLNAAAAAAAARSPNWVTQLNFSPSDSTHQRRRSHSAQTNDSGHGGSHIPALTYHTTRGRPDKAPRLSGHTPPTERCGRTPQSASAEEAPDGELKTIRSLLISPSDEQQLKFHVWTKGSCVHSGLTKPGKRVQPNRKKHTPLLLILPFLSLGS